MNGGAMFAVGHYMEKHVAYDVSIVSARERAARFCSSFESTSGLAGVEHTRRSPVRLADRHERMLAKYSEHVPTDRHSEFRANTLARLSGFPMDGAVISAARAALIEMGYSQQDLRVIGFTKNYDQTSRIGRSPRGAKNVIR